MNHQRTKILSTCCAATLFFGTVTLVNAQRRDDLPDRTSGAARGNPPTASLPSATSSVSTSVAAIHSQNLQRAAEDYEEQNLNAFRGRDIKAGDETLGTVHDMIVDPKTGRLTHVIASSGGVLGAGNKLRVLPIDRVQLRDEDFTTSLNPNAFEALPEISEADLESGRIPNAANHTRLSAFTDKPVRAANAEAGVIEDVVLDLQHGLAFAVVEVNGEFAGTEGRFLVPFDRLQTTSAQADALTTDIRRADFAHVQPESLQAAGSPAQPNPEDQPLSPTGRADPGSDAPRHDGRKFGAAQDDSTVGGAAPHATPTDRDAANTDGRPNLSTAVPRSANNDPWFPDTGKNARGSVVPGNDDPDERLTPTGRPDTAPPSTNTESRK